MFNSIKSLALFFFFVSCFLIANFSSLSERCLQYKQSPGKKSLVKPGLYPGSILVKKPGYLVHEPDLPGLNPMCKFKRVQNACARLVCYLPKSCHITPVLRELLWLPVRMRIKILFLPFEVLHDYKHLPICHTSFQLPSRLTTTFTVLTIEFRLPPLNYETLFRCSFGLLHVSPFKVQVKTFSVI